MASVRRARGRPLLVVVSHEASLTGAPKVAGFLLDAMRELPIETMIVHRWGGPLKGELDAAADRHCWEPGRLVRVTLRRFGPTKAFAVRWEKWIIRRFLGRVRPDAVWCNTSACAVWATLARERGVPAVLHVHELGSLAGPWLRRAGLDGGGGHDTDGLTVVACSQAAASDAATLIGLDSIQVLSSPVDIGALRRATTRPPGFPLGPVVLACGTADRRKGADVFRVASAELTSLPVHPTMVWVGGGPEANGRTGPVLWVGPRTDAAGWIASADVVVVPSLEDAFPLVVMEAMALGKPLVASAVGGIPEQVGDTAVLVPPSDPQALTQAVADLLADPERAADLGRAAAARCEALWDVSRFARHAREIVADMLLPEGDHTGVVE